MTPNDLLIVVPARGGSKGLPRKNLRRLGDIPLIGWTAEVISKAGLLQACAVLSTDDQEIAQIGRDVGLEVPFIRSQELASDTASLVDVTMHALHWAENLGQRQPKAIMLLQPTSPFRSPIALRESLNHLSEVDAVVGVYSIQRSFRTLFFADGNMNLTPLKSSMEAETTRQSVRPLYTPNGALYLIKTETLRKEKTFFPAKTRGVLMNQIESLDLDDEVDWQLLEATSKAGLTWRSSKRR